MYNIIMMKWTDEQYKAISDRGRNLMVAAAAGSGKTAVLVERIKTLILKDGCPIDRMLVVTFTNAAASEMKAKIEKAIRDEIDRLSVNPDQESRSSIAVLKRQLDLLPMANISTFHSFAMEVVKKFFYVTGAEPNFRILDDTGRTILEDQAMDQMMESRYEEGSAAFYDFLNKFGGDRSDDKVRNMVSSLSARMESLPFPEKWLEEKTEELSMGPHEFSESEAMVFLWDEVGSTLKKCRDLLRDNLELTEKAGMTGGRLFALGDYEAVNSLMEDLESREFDRAGTALSSLSFERMNKKAFSADNNPGADPASLEDIRLTIDSGRKSVKEAVKGLKEGFFSEPLDQYLDEIRETYEDALMLKRLTEEYRNIYSGLKKEKGFMDFSDLEHTAFEILRNEEVSSFYRNRFRYIFVDEYQDSNFLQEALIQRIAGTNNLFTVGDVKQSIYGFRLAEPEIFENRYRKYRAEYFEKGEESNSLKIDLNKNFRSKQGVVNFINEVFRDTMEGYGEEEALYAADPFRDKLIYNPELYLINDTWEEDEEIDDDLKELKKTEKEALLTVRIIREYLGKPIFDSKAGKERPLGKKDIVILMRGIKDRGDIFYKVLMENNIPCFVDDNKGYFDTIEINTFMSLLEIIDNHKQDLPLLTVMRSEIMGFSISDLAEIRAAHKEGSYFSALKAYSEEGEDEGLRNECALSLRKIAEWQAMARVMPLEELVWKLMVDTGFYAAMGAMPGGTGRQANLRLLADKALDYRKNQGSGLYGFIGYVDHIKKKDIKMGQARIVSEDEDTVRIMTIHHSKGLEFPMVILSGYTKRPGGDRSGTQLVTDRNLGIGLPYVRYKENWYKSTLLQKLIKRKAEMKDIKEEKRVLYVAMTRAQDILVLTGTAPDPYEALDKVRVALPRDTSYFEMTGRTIMKKAGRTRVVDDRELARVARMRRRSAARALEILDSSTYEPDPETDRIMRFEYPYSNQLKVKSKYSVSELNAREYVHENTFDPSVPREPEKNGLSAGHIGTVTHSVLEKMDFFKMSSLEREGSAEYLRELLRSMVSGEYLNEDEAASVDIDKLCDFAYSDLGRRIASAQNRGTLRREKPFNLKMEVEGEEALVQGIIDCFFIENGKAVLVDYKTTAPRNVPGVKERYAVQMDIYRKAIEEATGYEIRESYLYLTNLGLTVDMM